MKKRDILKIILLLLGGFCFISSCKESNNQSESIINNESSSIDNVSDDTSEKEEKFMKYNVNYYFEGLDGSYSLNSSTKEGKENDIIEVDNFKGFSIDAENENNILRIALTEKTNTLVAYYKRNVYSINVYGGKASKSKAKYGETIALYPSFENSELYLKDTLDSKLINNQLTVGAENITVYSKFKKEVIINSEEYLDSSSFSIRVTLNINDLESNNGIIFMYNDESSSINCQESFLLVSYKKQRFYLYEYLNGNFTELKSKKETITEGSHDFQINYSTNGISFLFDDEKLLEASNDELATSYVFNANLPGRFGIYSENKDIDISNYDILKGKLTIDEVKSLFKNQIKEIPVSYYAYDDVNFKSIEEKKYIDIISIDSKYKELINNITNKINNAANIKEICEAINPIRNVKLEAIKKFTWDSLNNYISTVHDSFFMHLCKEDEVSILDTGISLKKEYDSIDLRYWVPSCYKLRAGNGEIGLLDKLEEDIKNAKSFIDVYNLADLYINDLVRACCFKDIDFYYSQEYNIDPESTYSVWWYVYNYSSSDKDFRYYGNVFKDYKFDGQFRLNKFLYDPTNPELFKDLSKIVEATNYILNYQVISARKYEVTLNTNGGLLSETILKGTSATELVLPIPTYEGKEFDGWYTNRLFTSKKITTINTGNKNDITLYAKWKNLVLDIILSDVIGENMVVCQNKPIVFSGTGVNNKDVIVTFDNVLKKTTIKDGKWKVVFDAKSASFVPKKLVITCGTITYQFNNILVGEVWLTAGQSNMEFYLSWLSGSGYRYIGQYGNFTNLDKIRIMKQYINDLGEFDSNDRLGNKWIAPSNVSDVYEQSAYSIAFACYLQEKLNVPIGIICSSRGGTYIEEWLSEDSLAKAGTSPSLNDASLKSRYYNGMTSKLTSLTISGVLWYQGENNYANANLYAKQFIELVNQYRTLFNDNNLPIISTQLVQYGYLDFKDIRLTQWKLTSLITNHYCVCGIDTGNEIDIHPIDKITIGKRAANIALEYVYKINKSSLSYYPISASLKDNKLAIKFKDDEKLIRIEEVKNIKLKLEDGRLIDATGKIVNNSIVIDTTYDVKEVYYLYAPYIGNIELYGDNNLPIATFVLEVKKEI